MLNACSAQSGYRIRLRTARDGRNSILISIVCVCVEGCEVAHAFRRVRRTSTLVQRRVFGRYGVAATPPHVLTRARSSPNLSRPTRGLHYLVPFLENEPTVFLTTIVRVGRPRRTRVGGNPLRQRYAVRNLFAMMTAGVRMHSGLTRTTLPWSAESRP
jgi:hypothetical protein